MTATKNDNPEKQTMTAQTPDEGDKSDKQDRIPPGFTPPPERPGSGVQASGGHGGYFAIYKKGQGYWTRMGTVAGVVLIGVLSGNFIWSQRVTWGLEDRGAYILIAILGAAYALTMFYILNKPTNVDFLISTDSEMKRVNWTNSTELFGSTRVVIAFMFIMASVLFLYDLFFQTFFYLIGILKTPPPFFPNKH
jgi:preprotein translocase SecE subunit